MKIPEEVYISKGLRGKDLSDVTDATIKGVEEITFNQGKDNEQEKLSLQLNVDGMGDKSTIPNKRNWALLVEAFGDETEDWVGKKIKLAPVPSQTPEGKPTTVVGIIIPKVGKK